MKQLLMASTEDVDGLNNLPMNVLPEMQEFMAFLHVESKKAERNNVAQTRQNVWKSALKVTLDMQAKHSYLARDGMINIPSPPYEINYSNSML